MANHLDIVPVRTNDEGRIVVRVISRTQARLAMTLATGTNPRLIKVVNLLSGLGREREVKMRRVLLGSSTDAER